MEGMMADRRTKDELAGALCGYAAHLRKSKKRSKSNVALLLEEAAARLRSMPEGEMIEGWIDCDYDDLPQTWDRNTWARFTKGNPKRDSVPATLIIQHGEQKKCTCIRYAACPVHGDPQSDTVIQHGEGKSDG